MPNPVRLFHSQVTSLFRTETRLARAEINEKITQAGSGVGMIVAGAVLLISALVVLLQAAVAALIDQSFEPHIAALIVGGAAFLSGFIIALIGVNQLKVKKLTPDKTMKQSAIASIRRRSPRACSQHRRARLSLQISGRLAKDGVAFISHDAIACLERQERIFGGSLNMHMTTPL